MVYFPIYKLDNDVAQSNCSDGDLRLVGGTTEYEGTVEVCINRVWGSVCSSSSSYYWNRYWDVSDSKVVCSQLGHQRLGKHNITHLMDIFYIIQFENDMLT